MRHILLIQSPEAHVGHFWTLLSWAGCKARSYSQWVAAVASLTFWNCWCDQSVACITCIISGASDASKISSYYIFLGLACFVTSLVAMVTWWAVTVSWKDKKHCELFPYYNKTTMQTWEQVTLSLSPSPCHIYLGSMAIHATTDRAALFWCLKAGVQCL